MEVKMNDIKNVLLKTDEELFFIIYGSQKARWNAFYNIITNLGGTSSQIFLVILLSAIPSTRAVGLKLGFMQLLVTAIVQAIKRITSRIRPYDTYLSIVPQKTERDFSFPSGHTAAAFSCAITLGGISSGIAVPLFGLAMLIAYSRIYLGIHYPSDVMAGAIIGIGLASLL
jgi:undecaprenyl-diphosphatase